nr:immunoglobulin light chain junction region [Macaca mulatta]
DYYCQVYDGSANIIF